MFQNARKTLDAVTHKHLYLLLLGSMCLLISCGNQQVSKTSSTTSVSSTNSVFITTTTHPYAMYATTSSTIPFNTWFETASHEEMCAKVIQIWNTEARWPELDNRWTDEMGETFRKERMLLWELGWQAAGFVGEDMRYSSDAARNTASGVVTDFIKYAYGAGSTCPSR